MKINKLLVLGLAAVSTVGCTSGATLLSGVAYGDSHTVAHYVGEAKATVVGEKVVDVRLDEIYHPAIGLTVKADATAAQFVHVIISDHGALGGKKVPVAFKVADTTWTLDKAAIDAKSIFDLELTPGDNPATETVVENGWYDYTGKVALDHAKDLVYKNGEVVFNDWLFGTGWNADGKHHVIAENHAAEYITAAEGLKVTAEGCELTYAHGWRKLNTAYSMASPAYNWSLMVLSIERFFEDNATVEGGKVMIADKEVTDAVIDAANDAKKTPGKSNDVATAPEVDTWKLNGLETGVTATDWYKYAKLALHAILAAK